MRKVTVEFPVVGYAEVVIEVDDDTNMDELLEDIRAGDVEVLYDGHSHCETLTPLYHIDDADNLVDLPFEIAVID